MEFVDMNFSLWQWRAIAVLDVLINAALIFTVQAGFGFFIMEDVASYVVLAFEAASVTGLQLLCLYFGGRFVEWLATKGTALSGIWKYALVLVSAGVLFMASFTIVMSVVGDFFTNVLMSAWVEVANLIPILLVAAFGCVVRLCRCAYSRVAGGR